MTKSIAAMMMISLAWAAPAGATEVFGGIFKHAVSTPLSLESNLEDGLDLQLGVRGGTIVPGTGLQPYLYGSLHTKGDTSFAAAGLSWKFGDRFFVRPGLGVAIHNGSAGDFSRPDRLAFGSRLLFAPELGVGARLSRRATVEASWIHLSHGQLFGRQNPGLDSVGVRFSLGL